MNNWKIITIETSGRVGNLAAGIGPQVICQKSFSDALRHSGELIPTLAKLCSEQNWSSSDIDCLFVSYGPGSFTGIRIAVTLAKALAFAHHVRIVAVPSLEAQILASREYLSDLNSSPCFIASVLEAGRGKVFTAVYQANNLWNPQTSNESYAPGYDLIMPELSLKPAELIASAPKPLYLLGEGIRYHLHKFQNQPEVFLLPAELAQPQAIHVHECGWQRALAGLFSDPDTLIPNYLRRPEAIEKWEELHKNA